MPHHVTSNLSSTERHIPPPKGHTRIKGSGSPPTGDPGRLLDGVDLLVA
jgi:hypothetical protein